MESFSDILKTINTISTFSWVIIAWIFIVASYVRNKKQQGRNKREAYRHRMDYYINKFMNFEGAKF